jgi:hypothetical protein
MKKQSNDTASYEAQLCLLRNIGINTLTMLQKVATDPESCKLIERKANVDAERVLKWLNRKGLSRLRGISCEFLDLLERANVSSIALLASSNADELNNALVEIGTGKGRRGKQPGLLTVISWIEQAKSLLESKF